MKKFTKDHEWLLLEGETVTVGITDYAQKALGDIVFVELPDVDRQVDAGEDMAVVESVKAASDVYAPIKGQITEINIALDADPSLVNSDPEGQGWFVKMSIDDMSSLDELLDQSAYEVLIADMDGE